MQNAAPKPERRSEQGVDASPTILPGMAGEPAAVPNNSGPFQEATGAGLSPAYHDSLLTANKVGRSLPAVK